jgi:hypothetical protein
MEQGTQNRTVVRHRTTGDIYLIEGALGSTVEKAWGPLTVDETSVFSSNPDASTDTIAAGEYEDTAIFERENDFAPLELANQGAA